MDSLNFLPYCIGILIGLNWAPSHAPKVTNELNKAPIAIIDNNNNSPA
jgi:hypothetical protein